MDPLPDAHPYYAGSGIKIAPCLVMPAGTQVANWLPELRLLVANVICVGRGNIGEEDGILQLTIKNGTDNKFAGLGDRDFAGKNT